VSWQIGWAVDSAVILLDMSFNINDVRTVSCHQCQVTQSINSKFTWKVRVECPNFIAPAIRKAEGNIDHLPVPACHHMQQSEVP